MRKSSTENGPIDEARPHRGGTILSVSFFTLGYQRSDIPRPGSVHGGGFVFDWCCLPNPGREERFLKQTGMDREVIEWMERRPQVGRYVGAVAAVVRICVEEYLARGYTKLIVRLGCTGGQHRSVFVAERLAGPLRDDAGLSVSVVHTERSHWPRLPGRGT